MTADLQPGRLVKIRGLKRLAVVLIKAGRSAKSTRHAVEPSVEPFADSPQML